MWHYDDGINQIECNHRRGWVDIDQEAFVDIVKLATTVEAFFFKSSTFILASLLKGVV